MGKFIDLTGQKFGRWTVINYNEEVSKQKKSSHWNCKCDCGNERVVNGGSLRAGKTQSCGCLQKEIAKKQWEDEEFRRKQINGTKEKWEDKEFRQKRSEQVREFNEKQWQDEEMKWKMGYKGGITPIRKHLGNLITEWFDRSKQEANYTCQLTGKRGGKLHTHHLYAFSSIVMDAHNTYNIEVKPQVKDYTEEELKLLEDYVAEWHKDGSNAVVLSEEVHKLFHSLYGKGGNTPEQYEEFKQRYINGEFKNLI